MQIIYAAPFVLISLIAFACFLAIPRLRRFAFRALVAPVAFGFCSIVAMGLTLVVADGLGLWVSPLVGPTGVLLGISIYFIPGAIGAWIAVEIVRQVETRLLNTQSRREFATRTIIALIIFGPAFIVSTGIQFKLFPRAEEWWPICLGVSFIAAALAATATYLLTRALQERLQSGRSKQLA
jgi:hypothetical protein